MPLAGRIDPYFSTPTGTEQDRCWREIALHQEADQSDLHEGIGRLELAGNADAMFENEDPLEQLRLLDFVRTARAAAERFAPPSASRLIYLQKQPPSRRSPIQFTD